MYNTIRNDGRIEIAPFAPVEFLVCEFNVGMLRFYLVEDDFIFWEWQKAEDIFFLWTVSVAHYGGLKYGLIAWKGIKDNKC